MNKHSPGPWTRVGDAPEETYINGTLVDRDGYAVRFATEYLTAGLAGHSADHRWEANSRLADAAPEMYEMIRRERDGILGIKHGPSVAEMSALLARIEGEVMACPVCGDTSQNDAREEAERPYHQMRLLEIQLGNAIALNNHLLDRCTALMQENDKFRAALDARPENHR